MKSLEDFIIHIILNSVAIINVIILVAILCFRKNNVLPNYILSFIFIIPGLYFIDNILICSNVLKDVPYSFFLVQILANLFPISVYYYTHLLLTDGKKYNKVLLIGSAITLLYSIGLTINFGLSSALDQSTFIEQLTSENYPISMTVYNVIFYVWQMAYISIIFFEIIKYQKLVNDNLASIDGIKITFIKQLISLLVILNFSLVIFYSLLPMPLVDYGILPVIVTIIYIFIMYFTFKNNAIFNSETYSLLINENQNIHKDNTDSHKEEIKVDRSIILIKKIETALYNDKIYLIPSLKLSDLANKIDEQPYVTSQVLNSYFKKSFFDVINELRVIEAKKLLKNYDSTKDKIDNIAIEVGFNSRAAFYRSFKKNTGKNPTDFVSLS